MNYNESLTQVVRKRTISTTYSENYNNRHKQTPEEESRIMLKNLINEANNKLNMYVNDETIKMPNQISVELNIVFLKIGDIDNLNEKFQAEAYVEACWQDDSVDVRVGFDPRCNWDPELFIENSVGNLRQDVKYKIEKINGKTMVYEMRMIKGSFYERLELWDFPLDVQDLTITVSSARDQREVKFESRVSNQLTINPNDFQQQQEWILYPNISVNKKFAFDVWSKHERPCFSVSSNIARRPGYYIYNAYMLIFLVSVLGFVPFSFPYNAPHFRIQTTCLLILSSVNFRWIVTQKLPTVSYLTTLDKYAIVALVFLVLLCCWHAIVGTYSDIYYHQNLKNINFASDLDSFAFYVIAALYLLFHLGYILFFLFKYSRYTKIKLEPQSVSNNQILNDIQIIKNETSSTNDDSNGDVNKQIVRSVLVRPASIRPSDLRPDNNEIRYENLIETESTININTNNINNIDNDPYNNSLKSNNSYNYNIRKLAYSYRYNKNSSNNYKNRNQDDDFERVNDFSVKPILNQF